ncbi:MAG: hypothetical protein QF486_03265 [Candidatus Woesearchaeota archaeon]|jgi:hypothetical protein|nr:hypothetical protein [Candidatus Woesearchaeota archaeon]MDP7181574.1 hypothetical protein [Candidatus Woesearchaeota archaeon]MDP7198616.1 hypothetical protein [Candidatus Woesearchaeota archaeon]MDP7466642.1 hypothetical protein [Candidatus Woesearchaeota archaeon]MDP7646898.1 hypothetical protein [Candidatus Woesearchaeota archaeon]|tara:strand:- start:79 stop:237 length:159 start_codon:yes stop_codon:yes gene_type:complete
MKCYQKLCEQYACGERSFLTKEEKVNMLKEYKEQLDKEVQAVQEKIEGVGKG